MWGRKKEKKTLYPLVTLCTYQVCLWSADSSSLVWMLEQMSLQEVVGVPLQDIMYPNIWWHKPSQLRSLTWLMAIVYLKKLKTTQNIMWLRAYKKRSLCHSQDHQNTPLSCFTLAACNKHETFRNLRWASSSYQCYAITVLQPNVCVMEVDACCEDKGRRCPKSQCTTGKRSC